MKKSTIVNKIHTGIIIYSLFGWLFKSQRNTLLLLLPTLQYQFLVNNNNCILQKKNTSKRLKYDELNEEDKIAVNNFVKKYYSHDLIYYNEHCK